MLDLRLELKKQVPFKTAQEKLLLATWNIREFSKQSRISEAYYYMAEIISSFDLVTLQEVGADLTSLNFLMELLGPNWTYIVTDSSAGKSGGGERLAFVYDKNKVHFRNIASEIVLPDEDLIDNKFQWARTPFCIAFEAGYFKFMICAVHIYFGTASNASKARRTKEIGSLAQFLKKRAEKENYNYIILGDFNITAPDDPLVDSLKQGGFRVPTALQQFASGVKRSSFYDQIAFNFQEKKKYIFFSEEDFQNAGMFDFYSVVFKEDEAEIYRDKIRPERTKGKNEAELTKYYKSWRTFQMSDHFPLWIELTIDFSDAYLRTLTE